jgi:Gpi18-like mannosyltransferase
MRSAVVEVAAPTSAQRRRLPLTHLIPSAVWRDALTAWLLQRVILVGLVAFWLGSASNLSGRSLFLVWTRWDGNWYVGIARAGYQSPLQAAFYPLMPLLERLVAPVVGGSIEWAGLLVANVAGFGAFLLLGTLVEYDGAAALARRTVLLLALYPVGMYLITDYTESLFLLLALACFLTLRTQRWLLAGTLAGLAALTRTSGLALLLPFAVAVYTTIVRPANGFDPRKRRELLRATLGALLPLAAFAGVHIALSIRFSGWDAVTLAEEHWSRHLDWPWTGIFTSLQMVFTQWPSVASMDLLFGLFWLAIACSMLPLFRQRLPGTYVAFTWACLLLALATPIESPGYSPLTSISRYLLVVFPCFVQLAQWSLRSRLVLFVLLGACVGLTIALTRIFAQGTFLA